MARIPPRKQPPDAGEEVNAVRLGEPSLAGVVRVVAMLAVCALGLYLLWRVRGVVRLGVIGLFLALALNPLVDAISAKVRFPRALIILIVYALLFVGVVLIGLVVVPSLVEQVRQISRDAPLYARDLRLNGTFRHFDDRYHITPKLTADLRRLPQLLGRVVGPLKDVTVQAFTAIGQLIIVLTITFLLVLRGRDYIGMAVRLTGPREARYRGLVQDIDRAVANYVLGNIAISILSTIATWIVLSILGVPYSLSLGFVVGVFDLIPMVGATIGAIVVCFATATVSFPIATLVWLAFIIVWQRFEDYVVQPVVYGRILHVNPLVTIVAVLCGATLLGLLGALLAIPTAAAIQIVLRDWWTHRYNGEPSVPAPTETPSSQ